MPHYSMPNNYVHYRVTGRLSDWLVYPTVRMHKQFMQPRRSKRLPSPGPAMTVERDRYRLTGQGEGAEERRAELPDEVREAEPQS